MRKSTSNYNSPFSLTTFFLITFLLSGFVGFSQKTHIPDANFRKVLLDNYSIATENDSILNSDVANFTILNVSNKSIASLSGIEAFTSLSELHCHNNSLTSLDVSANMALTNLRCDNNSLTSLDISTNTALTNLRCNNNSLTSLDVSVSKALTNLRCNNNSLISLDISVNTALTSLECHNNSLTNLNVKNGYNYRLSTLKATGNTNLTCIQTDDYNSRRSGWIIDATASYSTDCYSISMTTNSVTSITPTSTTLHGNVLRDGGSAIIERGFVYSLYSTVILTIGSTSVLQKVSENTGGIGAFSESITDLIADTQYYYRAYATNSNETAYGIAKSFSTITNATTNVPDENFERALMDLGYDFGEIDGVVYNDNIVDITGLNVSSKSIESLAGIEAFTALTYLGCYENLLTTLDVSKNTALTSLRCETNQLTSLDVSKNTALTSLRCDSNQLSALDISKNTTLTELSCSSNQLTSLNLKSGSNRLQYFRASGNPLLTCIQVDNVNYSIRNWSNNKDSTAMFSTNCATAGYKDFKLAGISISPNPTADILNITTTKNINYRFLNIRGQTLKTGVLSVGKNKINISSFAKGIYFLNIKTSKGSFTEKVVRN